MKKMIIALFVIALSGAAFQLNAQGKQKVHVTKHKVFTTPNGKAYAYKGTNPKRKAYAYKGTNSKRKTITPQGKAVGYKGRNPRKANGKY